MIRAGNEFADKIGELMRGVGLEALRFGRIGSIVAALLAGVGLIAAAPSHADPLRTMGVRRAQNSGDPGQCTWGALQMWFQNSGYYPDIEGNAKDWVDSARAHGWTVVTGAQPRSIVVFQPGLPGVDPNGHSAWVNSVSQRWDGQWINMTEMNDTSHGGLGSWWTVDVKDEPGMSYILMP